MTIRAIPSTLEWIDTAPHISHHLPVAATTYSLSVTHHLTTTVSVRSASAAASRRLKRSRGAKRTRRARSESGRVVNGGSMRIAGYAGCRRNLRVEFPKHVQERLLGIRASVSSHRIFPFPLFKVGLAFGFNFFEPLGIADTSGLHLGDSPLGLLPPNPARNDVLVVLALLRPVARSSASLLRGHRYT